MTLNLASRLGISKLRKAHWADPRDHIELTLLGRSYGPFATLHSPLMAEIGFPGDAEQKLCVVTDVSSDWLPFEMNAQP